jgi:exodeoxyribonuclease VII small subunit
MAKKISARKGAGRAAGKGVVHQAPSFEQALEQLETIVRRLEDGQLPLAEALDQYEQGVRHLKTCHQMLERAERRIELVRTVDDRGDPITESFDETATCDAESMGTAGGRGRRKATRSAPAADNMDEPGRLF